MFQWSPLRIEQPLREGRPLQKGRISNEDFSSRIIDLTRCWMHQSTFQRSSLLLVERKLESRSFKIRGNRSHLMLAAPVAASWVATSSTGENLKFRSCSSVSFRSESEAEEKRPCLSPRSCGSQHRSVKQPGDKAPIESTDNFEHMCKTCVREDSLPRDRPSLPLADAFPSFLGK